MKQTKKLLACLTIAFILAMCYSALHAQDRKYKFKTNKDSKLLYSINSQSPIYYGVFTSLDDNLLKGKLVGDTLWINKFVPPFDTIKENSHELRYLRYNGKTYRYQFGFIDKAYFYQNLKGGVGIY